MPIQISLKKRAENMAEAMQHEIDLAQTDLDRFAHDFAINPAHAFSWGNTTFIAAARFEAAHRILRMLNDGFGEEEAIGFLLRETLRMAKSPERSTSQQSNLQNQELLAAYARLLDMLTNAL